MSLRVLFLCTHNSARSQMAEAWLSYLAGDRFEVYSAGSEATAVQALAIRAMAEVGISISGHESKVLDPFIDQRWNFVITVCDRANETCPVFPYGGQRIHWSIPDPAMAAGSEDEQLRIYREVRDDIRRRAEGFIQSLTFR